MGFETDMYPVSIYFFFSYFIQYFSLFIYAVTERNIKYIFISHKCSEYVPVEGYWDYRIKIETQ